MAHLIVASIRRLNSRTLISMLALCLVCNLVGCGQRQQGTSVLQRFNRLSSEVRTVTVASRSVSRDVAEIAASVRAQDTGSARRRAVVLRADAWRLRRATSVMARHIRALRLRGSSPTVTRYLLLISRMLYQQWIEGIALRDVASIVWHDPLAQSWPTEGRLQTCQRRAQSYARVAAISARQANLLLAGHPRSFRYTLTGQT